MRFFKPFFVCLFLLGGSVLSVADEFKLKNGATVVYEYTPHTQITSVQAWFKAGSVNENSKTNGISHFLEHILFKGTKNFKPDEIDSIVEASGGQMNAGTSKDYTMYYITLPVEHAETAFKVISDMVFHASFIPEEIEKEKPVVVQEIQRKFDNPTYEMWRDGMAMLYKGTPYEMEVIGTEDNVNSFTPKMLREYYASHYHPENMTLVVAGDISRKQVEKLAEKYFAVKPAAKLEQTKIAEWKPSIKKTDRKVYKKEVSQDYILMGYQVNATAKDAPVYEVLSEILSGGEYTLLNQELKYSKDVVTAVSAGEILSRDSGAFIVHMVTNPGDAEKAVKEAQTVLNKMAEGKIDPIELQKAKNRLESRTLFMKERASSLASEIGYAYSLNMGDYFNTYTDRIKKVSMDDVTKVAKEIFALPGVIYIVTPDSAVKD